MVSETLRSKTSPAEVARFLILELNSNRSCPLLLYKTYHIKSIQPAFYSSRFFSNDITESLNV